MTPSGLQPRAVEGVGSGLSDFSSSRRRWRPERLGRFRHLRGSSEMTDSPFQSIVCGIDGTREGFEAARQAARIAGPGGRLVLVAATHFLDAISGRWGPEVIAWDVLETPQRDLGELNEAVGAMARKSLDWAQRQVGDVVSVETRVANGRAHERTVRRGGACGGDADRSRRARRTTSHRGRPRQRRDDAAPRRSRVGAPGPRAVRSVPFPSSVVVGFDGSEPAGTRARSPPGCARAPRARSPWSSRRATGTSTPTRRCVVPRRTR